MSKRLIIVVVLLSLTGCQPAAKPRVPSGVKADGQQVRPVGDTRPAQVLRSDALIKRHSRIALVGATVHPVNQPPVENATLLIDNGKIVAVGRDVKLPAGVHVVLLAGKHVYPGLIDAYTDLGLVEINAIRASRDQSESGIYNPNVKAQVAVNPDSELIPVARANGVLLALTAPRGGTISGTSALIQLDGWTYEDMTVQAPVGMHVSWPRVGDADRVESSGKPGSGPAVSAGENAIDKLRRLFDDARAYRLAKAASRNASGEPGGFRIDARLDALLPVLDRQVPLFVRADELSRIESAVAFGAEQNVRVTIVGGYDAPLCAPLLKANDVPVIVAGTHRLPRRRDEPYDAAFTLPARLHEAGVRYCISGTYQFGASMVRNLPYHAATAAGYGLPREEALKAVTQYAAQLLGVGDRVGTLEPGKDATVIVTNGDPLEVSTHVEQALIRGRPVDLSSRHTRLRDRYESKYR